MEGCPSELEYVFKAQKLRKKMNDINNWELGMYIESAVATAVEHNLAGYKARSSYVKEPFSETIEKKKTDELKDNNKLLMATLQAWATNWKLEHPDTEDNNNG
jgi:hypothetical protein